YRLNRNFLDQIEKTSKGQFPYAVILSCIDSRVPTGIIFDKGVGDIFNVRIAGNVVNDDILGSMEFACKLAGAKLVLVMGHSGCGAVKGAYADVKLDHLTPLLDKIKPAVEQCKHNGGGDERDHVNKIAVKNVERVVNEILQKSKVIKALADQGEVQVVGSMYYVEDGKVEFFD